MTGHFTPLKKPVHWAGEGWNIYLFFSVDKYLQKTFPRSSREQNKTKKKRVTKGELLQRCFLFPPKTNDLRAHSSEDIKHQSCCFSPTWDKKSNARTTIRHDMNFCNCTVRSCPNWHHNVETLTIFSPQLKHPLTFREIGGKNPGIITFRSNFLIVVSFSGRRLGV